MNTTPFRTIGLLIPWRALSASCAAIWIALVMVGVDHAAAGEALSEASVPGTPFPVGEPGATGIAEASLEVFDGALNRYVEDGRVVGAEMLIIKNRQTVFHRAYGWKDREREWPMELNTIFNIRSMTKPITGAAVHLLADEGLLEFDDKASRYLEAFDNEKSGEISIEQLLSHRSGLPLTVFTISPRQYPNLQAIANEAGRTGPEATPGSAYQYSDAGTDTLGAIVEQRSGMALDAFWTSRILSPLGMGDTFAFTDQMDPADPRRARVATSYFGQEGEWNVFWSPEMEQALYPFAWGSQTLYSTPMDYARFLAMWLDEGVVRGKPLLSPGAVRRMLEPVSLARQAGSRKAVLSGFPGMSVYYGRMATLFVKNNDGDSQELFALGHSGSDGTWAWAFPKDDLIVLYFTQSHGQNTGQEMERLISRYLVWEGTKEERQSLDQLYREIEGEYAANFGPFRNATFTVLLRDGIPSVDFGGQATFGLRDPDENGKWWCDRDPGIAVSFSRNRAGKVNGLVFHKGSQSIENPRQALNASD